MTAHQDVAGLVRDLRERTSRIGPSPDQMMNFMDGIKPLIASAADRLESLSQALREAEKERDRNARNRDMWKGQCERQADQLAKLRAELSQKEAQSAHS
jgi:hypothetical protein